MRRLVLVGEKAGVKSEKAGVKSEKTSVRG